ncbi:hypothetical protein [Thalassiella azotivora]
MRTTDGTVNGTCTETHRTTGTSRPQEPQHTRRHLHPTGHLELGPVLRGGARVAVLAGLVVGAAGTSPVASLIPTVTVT